MHILCDFNLFDLHQSIMLVSPEGVKKIGISSVEELGDNIAFLCDKYDVHDVKLHGNKKYAEEIANTLIAAGNTKYGMFDINIEVI